jgi:hypothetical protein
MGGLQLLAQAPPLALIFHRLQAHHRHICNGVNKVRCLGNAGGASLEAATALHAAHTPRCEPRLPGHPESSREACAASMESTWQQASIPEVPGGGGGRGGGTGAAPHQCRWPSSRWCGTRCRRGRRWR